MPGAIHFYPNPVTFQTPSPINHQDYWKMVLAQQSAPWLHPGRVVLLEGKREFVGLTPREKG